LIMAFDIGGAAFALIAAVFWFISAYGKLPSMATYWNETPSSDPYYSAVMFSAKMNRFAAGSSGVSAVCIALGLILARH